MFIILQPQILFVQLSRACKSHLSCFCYTMLIALDPSKSVLAFVDMLILNHLYTWFNVSGSLIFVQVRVAFDSKIRV